MVQSFGDIQASTYALYVVSPVHCPCVVSSLAADKLELKMINNHAQELEIRYFQWL